MTNRDPAETIKASTEAIAASAEQLRLLTGRASNIRALCNNAITHDKHQAGLARSIINVLDGNSDEQIKERGL